MACFSQILNPLELLDLKEILRLFITVKILQCNYSSEFHPCGSLFNWPRCLQKLVYITCVYTRRILLHTELFQHFGWRIVAMNWQV